MKKYALNIIKDISLTILILTLSTALGYLFTHFNLHDINVVVLYIFSVLLISSFTKGYVYGIVSSVVSILLFNFFFTEPYYTLKVNDLTYLITFAIMLFTSIVASTLTYKVKKAASDAKERENESNALYKMTNHLTDAEEMEAIAKIVVSATSDALSCNASCICFDENGLPEKTFIQQKDDGQLVRRDLVQKDELIKRMEQLHSSVDITEENYLYPIYGKTSILAVLVIPNNVGSNMNESQNRMIHSIIESAALALEKLRSLKEKARSVEEITQERYRGNLLRAISHDIRTPLSGIMGTSEMLMDGLKKNKKQYKLAKDIYRDAQWLHGLVENILNLTKLQDGKLVLDKQLEALEEVIGATLLVMEKRLPDRNIDVEMPDNVLMVAMDAKLISQVLINLIDNAAKHTRNDKSISICVTNDEKYVYISVQDRGNGILDSDLPHIFKMFYTTGNGSSDSKRGVGLGLAICQSIVEAHGGTIKAENREKGGAKFTFTLPLGE